MLVRGIPAHRRTAVSRLRGQRRIRTGFPPYGHDDDALTLPAGQDGSHATYVTGPLPGYGPGAPR
ncbi:hypothetical protein GCM10010393_02400 [Streptomyces gobitricini]|uniref:Uncharacterized protein n=1 Tax=Streptomyces gobitricini TaxID=68211 RepID=A0ABN3L1D0_9ACTN